MEKPPVMISTKDLSYIEDMLNWNLVTAKKAHHFQEMATDPEVKTLLAEVATMHTKHYNFILSFLE